MFNIKRKLLDKDYRSSEFYIIFKKERLVVANSIRSGRFWDDQITWNLESLQKIFEKKDIKICENNTNCVPIINSGCNFYNIIYNNQDVIIYIEKSMNNYANQIKSDLKFERLKRSPKILYYLFERLDDKTLKVSKQRKSKKDFEKDINNLIILDNGNKLSYKKSLKKSLSQFQTIVGDTYNISSILKDFGFKYNKMMQMYEK